MSSVANEKKCNFPNFPELGTRMNRPGTAEKRKPVLGSLIPACTMKTDMAVRVPVVAMMTTIAMATRHMAEIEAEILTEIPSRA